MAKKDFYCDRCGLVTHKPFYRYPHVWEKPSNTCTDSIFSTLILLCPKCLKIYDKIDKDMRTKYLYVDNDKLIYFYRQYEEKRSEYFEERRRKRVESKRANDLKYKDNMGERR